LTMRERKQSSNKIIFLCLIIFGVFALVYFLSGSKEPAITKVERQIGNENYPLIVLLHGKPPQAPYEWNTGVWTAWGEHEGDLYQREVIQALRWQAEAAEITKTCSVHCHISHDQSLVPQADAVIMELVNHYKFYGHDTKHPIPWPAKQPNKKQYLGIFQYESHEEYSFFMNDRSIMDRFDFSMLPSQTSDLPVTLICNWGLSNYRFLQPPLLTNSVQDSEHAMIADFRGVIPPGYESYFDTLRKSLDIDFYGGQYRNRNAPTPYTLYSRIEHMGEYKFIIIAESIIEDDWICPEYSQALLSGAVPIYIGAPNIHEYLPGVNSIVHIRDFPDPEDLVSYLSRALRDSTAYDYHQRWKAHGLSTSFLQHLRHCAHLAECRICKKVLELNGQ